MISGISFKSIQIPRMPISGAAEARRLNRSAQPQLPTSTGISSGDSFITVKKPSPGFGSNPTSSETFNNPFSTTPTTVVFGASKRDGVKVGETRIIRRSTGREVKAIVTLEKEYSTSDDTQEDYRRYNLYVRGEKVGYTEVEPEDDDHIWVKYMEATENEKYKLIGTQLHQIAVEESINQGFNGRVGLYSLSTAVGFHYKSGFRSLNKRDNRMIAKTLSEGKRDGIKEPSFDRGLDMMLPEFKIRKWKARIKKNPILVQKGKKLQRLA